MYLFFKIIPFFFKKNKQLQEYHQSVKQIGSWLDPTYWKVPDQAWQLIGSDLGPSWFQRLQEDGQNSSLHVQGQVSKKKKQKITK